jgi:hypothetical protein
MALLRFRAPLLLAVAAAAPPPFAAPARSITVGALRFSFLSEGVLRVETAGAAAPEDRATVTFPSRLALPVPVYTVASAADPFVASTSRFTVSYDPRGSAALGCAQLNVTVALPGGDSTVSCVAAAAGRVPLDPSNPGTVMDEWTEWVPFAQKQSAVLAHAHKRHPDRNPRRPCAATDAGSSSVTASRT